MLLLPATISLHAQDLTVEVKNKDLLNKFFYKIPDDVTNKDNVTLQDGTTEDCANLSVKRFKRVINQLAKDDAIKTALDVAFKGLGLVVPGGAAKYALTALETAVKAATADDPDEFKKEVVKEAIKQVGEAGLKIKDAVAFEKSLQEFYKKIVDDLFGKTKELFAKNLTEKPCENGTLVMRIVPPKDKEPMNQFTLEFTINEECGCKYPDKLLESAMKLKSYYIFGKMTIKIDDIKFVPRKWRSDLVELTLSYGEPEFTVRANCNCDETALPTDDNISQPEPSLFAGASLISEDGYNRFFTYGVNVAYTHPIGNRLGITGDGGLWFGSNNSVNYTKAQLLGGISILPRETGGKILLTPHVLGGIVNVRASANGNGSTSLSAAVGADASFRLGKTLRAAARADYNPAFAGGGVSHNFRLSLGLVFGMGAN